MRKISILQESYMALEQKLAEAIDAAESKISSIGNEAEEVLLSLFSQIEDKSQFHRDPAFINFKNEVNIEAMVQEISQNLALMAKKIKESSEVSLEQSAFLSKVFEMLTDSDVEAEDEVAEVVSFFGGKEHTNIPDSKDVEFVVSLSDTAKSEAIRKIVMLRQMFEDLTETLMASMQSGQTADAFSEAFAKLSILEELVM
jgi:hypothetical protein